MDVDLILTVEEASEKGPETSVEEGGKHDSVEDHSQGEGEISEASWLSYLMVKKAEKGDTHFTHFLRFLEENVVKSSSIFQLIKSPDGLESPDQGSTPSEASLVASWQNRFDMEMQLTWLNAVDDSGATAMQLAIREGLID